MGNWPSMGNYGFYILMTYGFTVILMFLEPLILKGQRKTALKNIARLIKINAQRK